MIRVQIEVRINDVDNRLASEIHDDLRLAVLEALVGVDHALLAGDQRDVGLGRGRGQWSLTQVAS